jgi:hypothetical protein
MRYSLGTYSRYSLGTGWGVATPIPPPGPVPRLARGSLGDWLVRCHSPIAGRWCSMSTDIAQPTRQAISAQTRSRPGRVTGRLKTAIDLVVQEGLDPYEAAAKVGMHARSMRLALNRRHVLTYLRQAREVLRATASAQNIHYAIAMRAGSTNEMARLGAMKFIEGDDAEIQQRRGSISSPGLVIQIVQSPVQKPVIDARPELVEPAPVEPPRNVWVNGVDEPVDGAPIFKPPRW